MNSTFKFATLAAAIATAMTIAGCATSQPPEHSLHHPGTTSPQTAGMMSPGESGEQMSMMDMKSMCEMHKKMMDAKTPEERKATMDDRMKSMSPEMMKKHMAMMEKCK
jgi:hypothetical protein